LCGENLTQRADDNEETVKRRFAIFEEITLPLLEFYKSKGIEISVFDAEKDENSNIVSMI